MSILERLLKLSDDPDGMEKLYRQEPQAFRSVFQDALSKRPDSLLLQAWRARFEYVPERAATLRTFDLVLMVVLCLVAGSLYKIPAWTPVTESAFFPRYVALIPFGAMSFLTLYMKSRSRKAVGWFSLFCVSVSGYVFMFPSAWDNTFVLSCLYLPFFLWCAYGVIRLGDEWRSEKARIDYLRFFGEMFIHAGLFLVGGGVLVGLTFGLFELLNLPTSWVLDYVALYGFAAIPVVAMWATDMYSAARRMVPLLARIFSPLLLLLIVSYMIAMALNIEELFQERSTLLQYNVLLLCVLGTAVFTLTGRREYGEQKIVKIVLTCMLSATLLLDVLGVVAIVWRMYEYDHGLTVNRLAVLGSNLLVFGNLAVMCKGCLKSWKGGGSLDAVERGLARYLPAYSVWTAFMVFLVPWIYRY